MGDLRSTHIRDVLILITHIFNREGDDFQAHLIHIWSDGLEHLCANVLRVFDQFFNCELTNDTTQVPFHNQADQIFTLLLAFTQKLLCGGLHALFI